jgi:hypothetical protein
MCETPDNYRTGGLSNSEKCRRAVTVAADVVSGRLWTTVDDFALHRGAENIS